MLYSAIFFTTLSLSISFLARTGVCIQCDAGMCKSFFHVSCAHAAGFLSEPIYTVDHAHVGEPQSDAYLAHCKLHSDRAVVKKRRRPSQNIVFLKCYLQKPCVK